MLSEFDTPCITPRQLCGFTLLAGMTFVGTLLFWHNHDQKIIDEHKVLLYHERNESRQLGDVWMNWCADKVAAERLQISRLAGIEEALMRREHEAVDRGHARFFEHKGDPDDCKVIEFFWNDQPDPRPAEIDDEFKGPPPVDPVDGEGTA